MLVPSAVGTSRSPASMAALLYSTLLSPWSPSKTFSIPWNFSRGPGNFKVLEISRPLENSRILDICSPPVKFQGGPYLPLDGLWIMAPDNMINSALNYWAGNGTIYHLPLHHIDIAAPHHLHHTLRWQTPLCWPCYCCEDAVWHLESFRWVGLEFSKQEREFLSWTPSTWIFISGLDADKVIPPEN